MDATQSDTHKSRKRDHTGRTAILTLTLALVLIASAGFFIMNTSSTDADGHTHDDITFIEWTSSTSLPDKGSYYLANDVTLTSTWNVSNGTVNLCLNGHSITMKQDTDYVPVIKVDNGNTLNLYDCSNPSTGKITHYSKTTDNNTETCMGGGLEVKGTFNMYGGSISGNTTGTGGGVFTYENGTFNMYGGTISENTANNGGGVYNDGTFNM